MVRETVGDSLVFPVSAGGDGVYRTELSLKVLNRWVPWIFSNPIYMKGS
jgi:hypothetical protein